MVLGGGFWGKKGCGSKPFASRLNRFAKEFVGCIVISLLSLSDFGRRLGLSPVDFGRRLSSRFCAASVSCITVILSLGLWSAAFVPVHQSFGLWSAAFLPLGLWSEAVR